MLARIFAASVGCLLLGLSSAQAHFIWIDLAPGENGAAQARLYFSETAAPGEPHLIGKIAHTKAWTRDASGKSTQLAAGKADEEQALLPLAGAVSPDASLEAACDYGVYEQGPGVRLFYYTKRLPGNWARHADKLARADHLKLDIVPSIEDGKLNIEVLYDGQPHGGAKLSVVDSAGHEQELTTDARGHAVAKIEDDGPYSVIASRIEQAPGEHDGKKFTQVWHYTTLLVDVRPATAQSAEQSAPEALRRAREDRALWEDFPGFTADIAVTDGDVKLSGKTSIDASGVVELELQPSPITDWVEEQLNSMVQHRMPDGEVSEGNVTWAEDHANHPLGRLISLGEASFDSKYRIKDNVIMEVNRSAGPATRFTISVLEIERNAEDKYLPRSFTMNFFNTQSKQLTNSLGYWNEWQRVGKFDLPKTIIEVNAQPSGASTRKIVFSNLQLIRSE